MIIGNGIDIVEISRIKKTMEKQPRFLEKIFSEGEQNYIKSRGNSVQTIGGLFAAKEAISKVLGTGVSGFKWQDIVVEHDALRKPYVTLKGGAKVIAEERGIRHIVLSISHTDQQAIAFAIGESHMEG